MAKLLPPAVTDPVVIDGVKYRIRSIDYGTPAIAHLRTSFKSGGAVVDEKGHAIARVRLDELIFDSRAGVWRQGVL